ncbi:MAG: MBL fold metallo-hydrolase [Hadesarchaea archaeon]|nr:MBL fold metallo-hydrolase [Hadesarchaea archaeon]
MRLTSITLYGGRDEIGGNKVLLEDEDLRFFLDFGLGFERVNRYFAEFLQPRSSAGLRDYLELGLVPRLQGLYREDLLKPTCMQRAEPAIDGALLSHPHMDHAGCIPLLDQSIPIHCTATARRILEVYQESSRGGFENEFLRGKVRPFGKYVPPNRWEEFERPFALPEEAELELEALEVDHSTFGACGYLIYASEGTIAYTGDLRLHGPRRELSIEFIRRLREEGIDVLIIEGTNVGEVVPQPKLRSEEEVKLKALEEVMAAKDEPVFVDFSPRDFDRLRTMFEVASLAGRTLVVPTKLAYYVKELGDIVGLKLEDLLVYIEPKELGSYDEREYHKWERDLLSLENSERYDWLREHMDELIIYMDYYSVQNLVDLRPERGVYIHATSEPITEEQAIDFRRFRSWLEHFNLRYRHLHASGHLSSDEVFRLIEDVAPKLVIPVHTKGYAIFKREVPNVVLPEEGVPVELTSNR